MTSPEETRPTGQQQGYGKSGFFDHIGFTVDDWSEGRAVLGLELEPFHLNRANVLHGGVLSSMIDIVAGMAGLYCPVPGHVRKAVTLSLTTSFTGQISRGRITATGTARVIGRQIFFASAEVTSTDGRVLAIGEGTYRYRKGSEDPTGQPG